METDEHIEAARKATRDVNAPFLTTLLDGKYPESYLAREGANAPKVEEGDMKAIGSPLDFVGLNIYVPLYARADGSAKGYAMEPMPTSYPHMYFSVDATWAGVHLLGRTQCVRYLEGQGARRFISRRMERLRMMC